MLGLPEVESGIVAGGNGRGEIPGGEVTRIAFEGGIAPAHFLVWGAGLRRAFSVTPPGRRAT